MKYVLMEIQKKFNTNFFKRLFYHLKHHLVGTQKDIMRCKCVTDEIKKKSLRLLWVCNKYFDIKENEVESKEREREREREREKGLQRRMWATIEIFLRRG